MRTKRILTILKKLYPDAKTELNFNNPFELLVATVLSAQATDKSVNLATKELFKNYPDARTMSQASIEAIEKYIKTIGLYKNKAKFLKSLSEDLSEKYDGQVPNDFEALLKLAGVGRKTANVVLSNAYGRPAIAVDTHVSRLSQRLELTKNTNPDLIEQDLMKIFASKDWIFLHHALILHGRRICTARNPKCLECEINVCSLKQNINMK